MTASEAAHHWRTIYQRLRHDPNDADAWSELEFRVRAWARAALRDFGSALIDDAVQDTCASVVIELDRAWGADTFRGFVYGQFLNARRRLLRETRLTDVTTADLDGVESTVEDSEAWMDSRVVDMDIMWRALDELPVREHRALILRYMESASAERIATELGITPGNARRVVHNGLQKLRRRMAPQPPPMRPGRPQRAVHASNTQPGVNTYSYGR